MRNSCQRARSDAGSDVEPEVQHIAFLNPVLLTKEVLYRLSYVSGNFLLLRWNDSLVEQVAQWSGRRESNPRNQLGKLRFYH